VAGFDHYRAGRTDDARREWKACLELDGTHDFCEFGLSVLDAGAPKPAEAEVPVTAAPPPATETGSHTPSSDREAQQSYLEGVIYFQKGDYEKARVAWRKAKVLAPKGSDTAKDAQAGLERLDQLGVGKTPSSLKAAPEKKDEHEALQTYFTGLIYFQKGDLNRARVEWTRALALAPKGSGVESDAKAALAKLE